MYKNHFKSLFLVFKIVFLVLVSHKAFSCSMYKVTLDGKTMVGCNHDAWYLTPRIWFETNGYGAAFTGARYDGSNGFAPQSGMNEYGLSFSRLASALPENGIVSANKKQIKNPTLFLKDILHTCKTVEEVKKFIDEYDHSYFANDVFIYIDKSGKYLVVEPYLTTIGNDDKYVLANFCPSTITNFATIKQARYINGTAFLKNKIDTSISFCTALSDTMHVCRKKIGDGTLITSIWDLNNGITYLYFYHNYKHQVKFNLKEELAKGNHIIDISSLFPPNEEFKKLLNFKTPMTSKAIDIFIRFCLGLFLFSALFFLISYFRKKLAKKYAYVKLILFVLNIIALYYTYILATEMNIYYFPAPYKDAHFSILNIAAYIPFLMLISIIPLIVINIKVMKLKAWRFFALLLFALNNLTYLTLIVLFAYWGLFAVFN